MGFKNRMAVWSRVVPFDRQPPFGAYEVVQGDDAISDLELHMATMRANMFTSASRGLSSEVIDNLTAGLVRA